MASHETTVSHLITTLSEAYRHTHALFAANGLDTRERAALRPIAETLHGLQQLDDDMAEGFAKARYGRTLPYHEKRRRMTANSNIVHLFADDEPEAA